jgi:hypothetical protein
MTELMIHRGQGLPVFSPAETEGLILQAVTRVLHPPVAEAEPLLARGVDATWKVVGKKDGAVMKAQPPTRSMRYLLSIDRSLGRVSLRKMSVRVKNAKNRVRSRSAKKSAAREATGDRNTPVTNRWRSARAAAPALIAIGAAAMLIVALGAFQRSDSNIASVTPATSPQLQAVSALDTTRAATEPVPPAAAAWVRTRETPTANGASTDLPRPQVVEPAPHPDAVPHADAIPHAKPRLPANSVPNAKLTPPANSSPIAEPPHGKSLTSADNTNEEAVTISGCLQGRDDSFWLKDASGGNAPKSRSWKSGFLKKHAEPVQVVDATRTLQLSNYIAQRVIATGTLANRTMQARSLERVAASCH